MLADAVHKVSYNADCKLIDPVVIISVFREISLNFVVDNDILGDVNDIACLVLYLDVLADRLYLGVFDS